MDVRGNHSSEDVSEEESFITQLPEWARERGDGQWYGSPATGRSSRRAKPKAATKLIVVLLDEGEDAWAKARVFDNPGEATALVEMLVDDGLAPEQVSIFSATQMVIDVAYRPLVQFTESSKQQEAPGTV